jgi:hypothetical protein
MLSLGTVQADYGWDYVDVSCDPVKQRVTIQLNTLWNEDPNLGWHRSIRPKGAHPKRQEFRVTNNIDYGECFMSTGKPVRVKMSSGDAMPYGMCGGDPEIWLSVWVDKRKWLSRHHIAGRCTTNPISRIVISPTGMVVCSKKIDEPLDTPPENVPETCKVIPKLQLARSRDLAEYPIAATARAEPGSIVIEQGKDPILCKAMIREQRTEFGRAAWFVELPPDADGNLAEVEDHGLYEYSGHFSKNLFDIDNDGKPEVIYGFHPSNHAHDADIYFVSSGKELDAQWPLLSETVLWKESPYVFPNAHGRCQNHACGRQDEDGQLTLQSYSQGDRVSYRFRYLHVHPFIWQGSTYFLLKSLDSTTRDISAVVKPVKDLKLEETCVFRTVVDNY